MTESLAALLDALRRTSEHGRLAEQRVAKVILDDPGFATRASIGAIATRAGVSEPTVTRLCRTIGCSGVRDLKIQLAGALYSGVPYLNDLIDSDDDVMTVKRKVITGFNNSIDAVDRALDGSSLAAAVDAIAMARSVVFVGVGPGSSTVVHDAPLRFIRLGMSAYGYSDPHQQQIAIAVLERESVVVAISNLGRSTEVIKSVEAARSLGLTTIAITSPQSPLTRVAQISLTVPIVEDAHMYFPAFSRLPHLMIVDIISTAVGLRRGESAVRNVQKIKELLRSSQ